VTVSEPIERPSSLPSDHDETSPFARAIDDFVFSIESLFEGYPLTTGMLASGLRKARKEFEDFIEPFVVEKTKDDGGEINWKYSVPIGKTAIYDRLKKSLRKREHALKISKRSTVITLVGQFDSYVGNLARAVLYEKSQIIDASERPITFADLVSFNTIAEARESMVDKEIDSLLRGSHQTQLEWFEKKLKIKLIEHCSSWNTFIELTERRNLFVHTDGKVSRQYLKNCQSIAAINGEEILLGDVLGVSKDYVSEAHEALIEVGVKCGMMLWRKVKEADSDEAKALLAKIVFSLLTEGKYDLARRLLEFALSPFSKGLNNHDRKTTVINLAQAHKWLGDETKVKEILDTEDWSGSDEIFQLARCVLFDRFEEAVAVMRTLHKIGKLSMQEYREWPLFQSLRKQPVFIETFKSLFGESLSLDQTISSTPITEYATASLGKS
jgi:hypothetical protein